MRSRLILVDAAAALCLLAAVVTVAPGELSKAYALMTIVCGVLPGLMLTGDVKLMNAGVHSGVSGIAFKALASTLANIPVGLASLWHFAAGHVSAALLALLSLVVLGASAQAFSPAWYYLQQDKTRLLRGKLAATAAKALGAAAALAMHDLTWALAGVTASALIEFGVNRKALPWDAARGSRRPVTSLGLAYGISRAVSAAIRVGLEQLLGALIASFLVIEQLVGGVNAVFDKYFARASRWRSPIRLLKLTYLAAMLALVPWFSLSTLSPQDRHVLLWLALFACAGLLPLSDMYTALQRRSQAFVATGSALLSLGCALILAVAWQMNGLRLAALACYVLLPGATFVFYWLASHDDRHHPQH